MKQIAISNDVHRELKVFSAENGLTMDKAIDVLLHKRIIQKKHTNILRSENLLQEVNQPGRVPGRSSCNV